MSQPLPSFAERLGADRRLAMLQLLAPAPQYTLHAYLLADLLAATGHPVSADRLRADLAWLAEQGLVRAAQLGAGQVVTLTERGADVAAGRAEVPGVARPRPA